MKKNNIIKMLLSLIFLMFMFITISSTVYAKVNPVTVRAFIAWGNSGKTDAAGFSDYLNSSYIDGQYISQSNKHVLGKTTLTGLYNAFSLYCSNNSDNDITVFYFSGHGYANPDANEVGLSAGSHIPFYNLYNYLNKIKGRKIVILDSCYSGLFINYITADKVNDYCVLTACGPLEYSQAKIMGRFSSCFLKGVGYGGKIEAPHDSSGTILVDSLYTYIVQNINNQSPRLGGKYRPAFKKRQLYYLSLTQLNYTIYEGDKAEINGFYFGTGTPIFSSSNTSVATVSGEGIITAKRAGKVEVKVTLSNRCSLRCPAVAIPF